MLNPYRPKPESERRSSGNTKADQSTQSWVWLACGFFSAGCFLLPAIIDCIRMSVHESSAGMAMAPVEAIPLPSFVNPVLYSLGGGFALMAVLTGKNRARRRLSWMHWFIFAILSFGLSAVDNPLPSICFENLSGDQTCFYVEIPYQTENVLVLCGCLCIAMTLWALSRLRNKRLV